jgi:mannitol-1-phosphate 5-dehydrogenase
MRAVVIGAGRIGCGLAGQLLRASGYEVTFITRSGDVVKNLRHNGAYHVLLTSETECRIVTVDGIKAIATSDEAAAITALTRADLIVTAVCSQNLPAIAPLIAQALSRREKPANVIAFENMPSVGECLRRLVASEMAEPWQVDRHGFSGAVISRMVTRRVGDPTQQTPLMFVGEAVEEFIVDRTALLAPLPKIRGMKLVDEYQPCVLHKLYTFSAGHATAAYLGWLKGYHYIHTAIHDPEIRKAVFNAMAEGQRGLAAKFGQEFARSRAELEAIITRFENANLNDPIVRVARDPHRKLAADERLVGAGRLAEAAGVMPQQLALVAAAALCFSHSGNGKPCTACFEQSQTTEALNEICGLDAAHGFGRIVAKSWAQLAPSLLPGNLLLSLRQRLWARV